MNDLIRILAATMRAHEGGGARVPRSQRRVSRARALLLGVGLVCCLAQGARGQYQGWDVPAGAKDEKSPLTASPDVVKRGAAIFADHCARCHGPNGKGDGKDSTHAADLTDDLRTELNTEGVLFYKVWNGHAIQLRTQVDDMPAFSRTLTRDQVWTVIEHLKVLRTPAAR